MRLLLAILLCLWLFFGFSFPSYALIRVQEEATGQMLWQSRHSLRDNRGISWQIILFKRLKNHQIQDISLRLVGFPDMVTFRHPQPLILTTTDHILTASDQFAQHAPAPNVGQYDLQTIIAQLQKSKQIELDLPLDTLEQATLSLPTPVLIEWQDILSQ